MKIWTCGSSPRSGSRNVWMRIKNVNGASRLSNFWNFFGAIQMISCRAWLVTMDETWLYHYDPETKQQSMEWRHSGSPRPQKIPSAKIRWKFLASIVFWDQDGILLIIFQRAKLSTPVITHLCWLVQLKDILKEKLCGNVTKAVLSLNDSATAHWALATQKNFKECHPRCACRTYICCK